MAVRSSRDEAKLAQIGGPPWGLILDFGSMKRKIEVNTVGGRESIKGDRFYLARENTVVGTSFSFFLILISRVIACHKRSRCQM